MGELFNSPHEWMPLVTDRLIDFIRIHISQMGGLTPARKIAALCEFFGVRTAWHGPGDVSPVGHAANVALDLRACNFGIQEGGSFPERTREVFPGCPEPKTATCWPNETPGWASTSTRSWRRSSRSPTIRRIRLLVGHDAPEGRHGDQTLRPPADRRNSRRRRFFSAMEHEGTRRARLQGRQRALVLRERQTVDGDSFHPADARHRRSTASMSGVTSVRP